MEKTNDHWPNEKFAMIEELWDIDMPDSHKNIKEITE